MYSHCSLRQLILCCISPGSAVPQTDYEEVSQTFDVQQRQDEFCVNINIINDNTAEKTENFTVRANLETQIRLIETFSATVSITDDDNNNNNNDKINMFIGNSNVGGNDGGNVGGNDGGNVGGNDGDDDESKK